MIVTIKKLVTEYFSAANHLLPAEIITFNLWIEKSCRTLHSLNVISEKWTFLVLYTLENNGKMRFNDIYRCIPDISQKMLAATLRTLKEDGIISRTIYPEVPPKVEYELTDRGLSLLPHIDSLIGWAIKNFDDILADRKAAQ